MWYQINTFPDLKGHCVYKLIYHGRYVIIACKTIQRSVQNINIGLQYFFKNTSKGRNQNDLYYKFYCYVADNPFNEFVIDVIAETESPYEMLKAEHLALEIAKCDENCLNKKFEVYIPQYTQVNGKKSWINRGFYLNFMEWKRKRLNQSNIE